jgi:DNA replication and repair protein RecF
MSLRRLEVSGLRNLRNASLEDCGRINILVGPNGSGKTSFLEAIYLLGLGRSFRSSRLTPIINYDTDAVTVYGGLSGDQDGYQSLGVLRSRQGRQELRINKAPVENVAELARALPLQLINSESFALIVGGPKVRRQFMDWGVFHVKPAFLERWRKAQRCLKQRNYLLRAHRLRPHGRIYSPELAAWDQELALCAEDIDRLRARYIEEIAPLFSQILRRLVDLPTVSLGYQRGWSADIQLQAALEAGVERDIKLGSTAAGPHRANLDIRVGGVLAAEVLSRGQLKLVVSSLRLAQGAHLARQHNSRCVYLVDDLPAELDKEHRATLCQLLDEMGCQVFITCVDADTIESSWSDISAVRQFHVKQGRANREI